MTYIRTHCTMYYKPNFMDNRHIKKMNNHDSYEEKIVNQHLNKSAVSYYVALMDMDEKIYYSIPHPTHTHLTFSQEN